MDQLNKELSQDNNKKKKKIAIIIAAILLIAAIIGIFIYNNAITAVTMRIQRLVGTVNLYNEEGNEQSLREKMRLGAGQTVTTAGESLIMVSLDDTKLMTMEETSKAEIKARGKKLLFNLLEGNLFFNVTEKLKDNESFDISTSTMVCGIRGTSAYVGRDSTSHEILMVTDGLVHVVATNPVTKETTEVDVPAGQMITIYLDEEAEGDKTISIRMRSFKEEDLPAMALDTMRKNKALMDRVAKATGFSVKKLATLADLSSTKGISMYGSAADDFKSEGVDDAIPFMGNRSHEMTASANSALNIAKDDLPLEVAIIQGYRDVMDVGIEAGYDRDNLGQLMRGTRGIMEDTFVIVDRAGLRSLDRINVATRVSDTLKVSAGRMTRAELSTEEIGDVMEAEKTLITGAVSESAGTSTDGSKGNDVLASLDKVSEHITGTVDEEMDKSSNGDETVIALLGSGDKNTRSGKSSAETTEEPKDDDTKNDTKTVAAADGESTPNTGDATSKKSAGSTGGASSAELKTARSTIVATDPQTGIVALADGTLFDPVYYAAANPDVVAEYGTSTEALLAEWLKEGKAQGRPPIAPQTTTAQTETKPDWLIRQEEQERQNSSSSSEEPEQQQSSNTPSTPSTPSGGGTNSYNPNTGATTLADGTTGHYDNTNNSLTLADNANTSITLPLTLEDGSGGSTTINGINEIRMNDYGSATITGNYAGTTITRNAVGVKQGKDSYTYSGNPTNVYNDGYDEDPAGYVHLRNSNLDQVWINKTTGAVQTTQP